MLWSSYARNCSVCTQPLYLYDLISIQPPHGHNTRSSPYVTLIKPPSSLKVSHRFFRHASPYLWNQLPTSLRIPHPNYSSQSQRPSFVHAGLTRYTLLSPSITFSLFHSELKTTFSENLILHLSLFLSVGLISWLLTIFWIYLLVSFYVLVLFIFYSVIPPCGTLSWLALWSTFGDTVKY